MKEGGKKEMTHNHLQILQKQSEDGSVDPHIPGNREPAKEIQRFTVLKLHAVKNGVAFHDG